MWIHVDRWGMRPLMADVQRAASGCQFPPRTLRQEHDEHVGMTVIKDACLDVMLPSGYHIYPYLTKTNPETMNSYRFLPFRYHRTCLSAGSKLKSVHPTHLAGAPNQIRSESDHGSVFFSTLDHRSIQILWVLWITSFVNILCMSFRPHGLFMNIFCISVAPWYLDGI